MQERQYKILKLLYRSDGFVTVERLAADVNCSLKTIRNDLKQLGSFLEEYGLGKVVSKSNKGVCLIKDKDWDTAKQAWNDVNQMELYGTDKHFQILELLLKQRSIQKMKLEKRLLISRLDAEKATSQASVWLTAHHVAVTCKRGQGLQIECSEYYWRMAMWELFADISRKRQEFGDQTLKSQTEKFLWGFDMAGVTGAIAGLEKKFGIHYSFDGYQQLSFLLSLCVIRIRKKLNIRTSTKNGVETKSVECSYGIKTEDGQRFTAILNRMESSDGNQGIISFIIRDNVSLAPQGTLRSISHWNVFQWGLFLLSLIMIFSTIATAVICYRQNPRYKWGWIILILIAYLSMGFSVIRTPNTWEFKVNWSAATVRLSCRWFSLPLSPLCWARAPPCSRPVAARDWGPKSARRSLQSCSSFPLPTQTISAVLPW